MTQVFTSAAIFDEYRKGHAREHKLEENARVEARRGMERRLNEMNELRRQIDRERGTFQTKGEAQLMFDRLADRLNKIEQVQAAAASASITWTVAIGLFFTVLTVGMKLWPVAVK